MDTITGLKQLLAYNEWANRHTLHAFKESSSERPKALRALAHALVAEREWLLRLKEDKDTTGFDFWQKATLEEVEALAAENSEVYRALMVSLTEDGLNSVAVYKNSKGVEYRTSFRDILT